MQINFLNKLILIITFIILIVYHSFSQEFKVSNINDPAPGVISFNYGNVHNLKIVDNYGNNILNKEFVSGNQLHKKLRNGKWISLYGKKYRLYDDFCNVIDSIPNPTNKNLDFHDVEVLSNGHYLLLLSETVEMDLSNIVDGGNTNAEIIANSLVETDRTGQIYWQWNILDHIQVTDITDYYYLDRKSIDLTHINSMVEDVDGNIIISIRHFDEIAKISKSTGNFIWRMGGTKCKNNQFTFVNDTIDGFFGFSHQHSVTILENGNLLMFDNGNLKPNEYSRAVEYSVDYQNKTVSKVWEYRRSPDVFASSMGSAFRLANGNTLINWSRDKIQEIKPDKSIALEMLCGGYAIYQAQKVVSNMELVSKNISDIAQYNFMNEKCNTGVQIAVLEKNGNGILHVQKYYNAPNKCDFDDSTFTSIFPYRWVLSIENLQNFKGKFYFSTNIIQGLNNPNLITIYKRNNETMGVFEKLQTTYDSLSNEIFADITSGGEFILVSNNLDKPILINPIDNITVNPNGKLEWKKTIGAYNYQLQLSKSGTFENMIFNTITNNITFNYSNLFKIDTCFWRIRAMNHKDTTVWSEIGKFTTNLPIPKLLFPESKSINIATNTSLIFLTVNESQGYILEISESEKFDKIFKSYTLKESELQLDSLENDKLYFWRVKSIRETDSSKWSEVWNFKTLLAKPDLISPINKSKENSPIPLISWESFTTIPNFQFKMAFDKYFNQVIIDTIISAKELKLNELKPLCKFYWKVRAVNDVQFSDWTDIWEFSTGVGFNFSKPTLISPANNSSNHISGIMKWSKITNAIKYHLQIIDTITYNFVIDTIIIGKSEFNYKLPEYNSTYFWRVMALSNYSKSDWSDYFLLKTNPKTDFVILNLPINDELQVPINSKLEWFDVNGVDSYHLQLAVDSKFENIVAEHTNLKVNYYYYANLKKSTKYFWRVRYIENKLPGNWSEIWYFETEADKSLKSPETISPIDNATAIKNSDYMIWNSINGAESYKLSISTTGNFSNIIQTINNITDTCYKINELAYNQRYYWRVSAVGNDAVSNWSEIHSFISELKKPEIISPKSNFISHYENITFKWKPSEYNEKFTLQISKFDDFSKIYNEINDILNDSIAIEFNEIGKFYYRIKAFNSENESSWTDAISFVVMSEVSVDNNDFENNIEIFPNPCKDFIEINIIDSDKLYSINIYDIKGNYIQQIENNSNIIDMKNYQIGTYFIKIDNKFYKIIKE